MPIFDFQCRQCNHVFEFSRPFGSVDMPHCAECGSPDVDKLIAPPAVHFKGQGFYKTDSTVKPAKKKDPEPKKEPETPKAEQKADSPKKSEE